MKVGDIKTKFMKVQDFNTNFPKIEIDNFMIEDINIELSNSMINPSNWKTTWHGLFYIEQTCLDFIIILEAHHHLWWLDIVSSRKGKTGYKICKTSTIHYQFWTVLLAYSSTPP